MKTIILIFIVICLAVSCRQDGKKIAPFSNEVNIGYNTENIYTSKSGFKIYVKGVGVGNSYSSHIVWVEDSTGNIISVATH